MNIIAGPIVRHSNNSEINVWFVLDEKAESLSGSVLQGQTVIGANTSGSTAPVQAGKRLFFYLLKLVPNSGTFPYNKVLSYDLKINGQNLDAMGLTRGNRRISYRSGGLPGIVLKKEHKVILQGSCRKPHAQRLGQTQPDMLVRADDLVASTASNTARRPSLLFLTGDQIYADDVAAPMLALIRKHAAQYIGDGDAAFGDSIPHANGSKKLSTLKLNGRTDFLDRKVAGFTSGHKANHLLSFGEYLMMYLLVWGGLDRDFPDYDSVKNSIEKVIEPDDDPYHMDSTYADYYGEMKVCRRFLNYSWQVRRVLANVVTYMMFDDHEVTDDWNLTQANSDALRDKPFGKHIQVNALGAFWLCQGWGNTPNAFSRQGFIKPVENYYTTFNETKFNKCAKVLLGHYWGFELDTNPLTVVLDTRSRRSYNELGLARLMSREVLAEHAGRIDELLSSGEGPRSLLLVSPAPVYGFTSPERIQLMAVENDETMATKLDAECWMADEEAFKQLQSVIVGSGMRQCAIFSGDVHYGFCRYEKQINAAGEQVDIYQLTSSSLHNAPGFLGNIGLDLLAVSESFRKIYSSYLLPEESDTKFLNQSPNLGVLELNRGSPVRFTLDSRAPKSLKDTEAVNWYGPGAEAGFSWSYPLKAPRKLSI